MCSHYDPVSAIEEIERFYRIRPSSDVRDWRATVYPTGLAPFVRLKLDGSGERIVEEGHFGLLPYFAKEVAFGRKTYNARSETVHSKASFRESWQKGYRCVIPASAIYEQCYETGKAVRWKIEPGAFTVFHIAGIYFPWTDDKGAVRGTFAMLTVNADGHSVYSRFSAPGEEKRMVVLLRADEVDPWLSCTPEEATKFFKQYTGELLLFPAPLPPRNGNHK